MMKRAKRITIASGKGGTGKTTVAINLYNLFDQGDEEVVLLDCDVEEPNLGLFFADKKVELFKDLIQKRPKIHQDNCSFCRKCVDFCEFNAIVVLPSLSYAEINSDLCHSCGACLYVCNQNAIEEYPYKYGELSLYSKNDSCFLFQGELEIGSAMQTVVIRELKKTALERFPEGIQILDAPPGTSCPVVESFVGSDFAVLVTEPTSFGLNDLKLTVNLVRKLNIPFGVVINKSGLGGQEIYEYIDRESILLLGEIPFSKEYAKLYSNARLNHPDSAKFSHVFEQIFENIKLHL
ncbi:MAG: ATP-binding protein [Bacteroidales bacterium]